MSETEEDDILNNSADIFANSSTETVTEKFPPPPNFNGITCTSLSQCTPLIKQVICETNDSQRKCCPFCIFDNDSFFTLKEHIKELHPVELNKIFNSKPGEINFYQCPFCDSRFFHKELVCKHLIRRHELCFLNMFSGFSPDKYVYCRFCTHKVMKKHYKLLIIHIEKKHLKFFQKYIFDKYLNVSKNCGGEEFREEMEDVYASPGLSDDFLKLNTDDKLSSYNSPPIKSILKPRTAYPIEVVEKVDDIMLNTEVSVLYANLEVKPNNKSVRRRLRFDLPSGSPGMEEDFKENILSPLKRKKTDGKMSKLKQFLKSKKLKINADVSPIARTFLRYKCGICSESFDKNSKLLEHIRLKHKSITFQAQFSCGDCDAKFFKNSFLLKHCKYHHSPLCLKSSFLKDHQKF